MSDSTATTFMISQAGIGNLSEQEKQEYIDFVNADLAQDNAGELTPINSDQIHKNAFPSAEHVVAIIELLHYSFEGARNVKKLSYFTDKAREFLSSKGKDTSHMEQVEKMNDFVTGDSDDKSNQGA